MASSNHVTPTNCSWWPISAMDEDGKITDGEESEEPTAEPKPFSKDRLVLYHWTQSFASQKLQTRELQQHRASVPRHETRISVQFSSALLISLCLRDTGKLLSCPCCPSRFPPQSHLADTNLSVHLL
ncbi:unnamed protein product [Pleuronectes platessa]|uniref:Uncharacterized protein n=1 Tax=Pleuronectes platessa TaxID=8262 RepID=A0A9N7VTQ9_PLEPL|nr:unnamed protein product [Pleuronectes platessa]